MLKFISVTKHFFFFFFFVPIENQITQTQSTKHEINGISCHVISFRLNLKINMRICDISPYYDYDPFKYDHSIQEVTNLQSSM